MCAFHMFGHSLVVVCFFFFEKNPYGILDQEKNVRFFCRQAQAATEITERFFVLLWWNSPRLLQQKDQLCGFSPVLMRLRWQTQKSKT